MESVVIQSVPTGPDAPGTTPAAKPAWLPEKFWKDGKADHEGLAKSYSELEQKQATPPPANQTPDEKKAADDKAAADKAAADAAALKAAPPSSIPGVTPELQARATKEIQENKALSPEVYADLAKAGYPKAVVDQYIKGAQADQVAGEATVKEMKAIVGGDDGYAAMTAWMTATLTPAEIAGYDKAVSSQDKAVIELAVRGMHAKYAAVNGNDPNLLGGSTKGGGSGDVYESVAQLTADQRNPLYKSDEAFRKKVIAKLDRSSIL